jgi:hypothetical protein
LNAFYILSKIIQAAKQTEWIAKRSERCLPHARRDTQPGLFANIDHDAILDTLDAYGQGGLPSRHGTPASGDLHSHLILRTYNLCLKIPPVELSHQRVSDVIWFDISVENSPVHVFDYNPSYQRRQFVVAFHIS